MTFKSFDVEQRELLAHGTAASRQGGGSTTQPKLGATSKVQGTAREKKRARDRARNEALPDSIVVAALIRGTRLTREDIPPELIVFKRQHILIRRELKRLNDVLADGQTRKSQKRIAPEVQSPAAVLSSTYNP